MTIIELTFEPFTKDEKIKEYSGGINGKLWAKFDFQGHSYGKMWFVHKDADRAEVEKELIDGCKRSLHALQNGWNGEGELEETFNGSNGEPLDYQIVKKYDS